MLDQENARALLTIADENQARVVFMGDRRQLPAVVRGGIMQMVADWTPQPVELDAVHRFRTPDGDRDAVYADLSQRIRSGQDPAPMLDELAAGGHVQLYETEADPLAAIAIRVADRVIAGDSQSIAVGTNEQAEQVNQVVREQLVNAGIVDDAITTLGSDGLRIGVGDQVVTRRNDNRLGIASRMRWTVTAVDDAGGVTLAREDRDPVIVEPDYTRENLHLAYVSTTHGVQGDTSDHGDELLADRTSAPAVYVGLTRGQRSNTLHVIAHDLDNAREQWVTAAGRGRPDIGLANARTVAAGEAADYAPQEPTVADIDQRIDEHAAENIVRDLERENVPVVDERPDRDLSPAERMARVREQFAGRRSRPIGTTNRSADGDGGRPLSPVERMARVREQSAARRARPIGETIDSADGRGFDQTVVDHDHHHDIEGDDPRHHHGGAAPRR